MISRIPITGGAASKARRTLGAPGNISRSGQRFHLVPRDAAGRHRSSVAAVEGFGTSICPCTVATGQRFRPSDIFLCGGGGSRSRSGLNAFANNDHYQHLQRRTLVTGRTENESENASPTEQETSSSEITIPGAQTGGRKLAIIFTCTHCDTRSVKQFSEKAYTQGVVIATCPGCQRKHLIADNLGYFSDEGGGWNVQKGMEELGEKVKVATNDNVLELTLDDIFTAKAIDEAVKQVSGGLERDESSSPKDIQQ